MTQRSALAVHTLRAAVLVAAGAALRAGTDAGGFDGEWTNHLACRTPSCLLADSPFVWVGTSDCGLFRYEPVSGELSHYTNLNSRLCANTVTDLASTGDGTVLAATPAGLVGIPRGGEWRVVDRFDAGWPVDDIATVCVDTLGNPSVGLEGGGVFGFDGGRWVDILERNPGFPMEVACGSVKEMAWGEDGALWLMLEDAIARLHDGQWWKFRFLHTRGFAVGAAETGWTCAYYEVPRTRIASGMFVLSESGSELYSGLEEGMLGGCEGGVFGGGNAPVWVAGGAGLFRLDGPEPVRYDYPDGTAGEVFGAGHDRRCWTARRMGDESSLHPGNLVLWELREDRWADHRLAEGLPFDDYSVMTADGEGVLWATDQRRLYALRDGEWQIPEAPVLDYQTIRPKVLKTDGRGLVYGLGWTSGSSFTGMVVFRQTSPGTSEWSVERPAIDGAVWDVAIDRSDRIWLGGDGAVAVKTAGEWKTLDLPGIASTPIVCVEAGADSTVWFMPEDGGIARWTPSEGILHSVPSSLGFAADRVEGIAAGAEGRAYLAIAGGELAEVEGNEWRAVPVSFPGIDSVKVAPLLVDRDGRLWCSLARLRSRCELGRYYPTVETVPEWPPAGLGVYDGSGWRLLDSRSSGLPSNAVAGLRQAPDGSIWILSDIGPARLVPGETRAAERSGKVAGRRYGRRRGGSGRPPYRLYDLRGRLLGRARTIDAAAAPGGGVLIWLRSMGPDRGGSSVYRGKVLGRGRF